MKQWTPSQQNALAVIGAALLAPEASRPTVERLSHQMFEDGPLRKLFAAIKLQLTTGHSVDPVTILHMVGPEYKSLITTAAETVPTVSHVEDYGALVVEDYRRQLLLEAAAAASISAADSDTICAQLRQALEVQEQIRSAQEDDTARDFDAIIDEAMRTLQQPDTSARLGWQAIDRYGLFGRGAVTVLSGRPGGGKTDLALVLAARLSRQHRVYYLTMEETRKKLMLRILSKVTRIDSTRMRDRTLTEQELASLHSASQLLKAHHNMVIDDAQNLTVEGVRAKLLRHKPQIAFIDHIGLLMGTDPKQREYERLMETTRSLKQLAMQMDICIVELVQLNRLVDKSGGARKATMADLRGSGTIEQDANSVLIIESEVNGTRQLAGEYDYMDVPVRVSKNREGLTGRFEMRWQPQYHDWQPAPDPKDDFDASDAPLPGGWE